MIKINQSFKKFVITRFLVAAVLFIAAPSAQAIPLKITEAVNNSVFHNDFNSIGWLKLDADYMSTYDPTSGDLHGYFDIYADDTFVNHIGIAEGTGNVPAANMWHFTGNAAGSIDWLITLNNEPSALLTHLESKLGVNALHQYSNHAVYKDSNYGTMDGYDRNRYDVHNGEYRLTLWGADNYDPASKKHGVFVLGSDIQLVTGTTPPGNVVPEPTTMLLFGSGLVGAFAKLRRSRKV